MVELLELQSVTTIVDVHTGVVQPGEQATVTADTVCDDLITVRAPAGAGEPGAGTPYAAESESLEFTKTMDNLLDLARNGQLHNEQLGMSLDSYVPTILQLERWMTAGELAGKPYTWEDFRSDLSAKLAVTLGRKPSDEELDRCTETAKLDISEARKKPRPPSGTLLARVIELENINRTEGLVLSEVEKTAAVEKLNALEQLLSKEGKNVDSLTKEQLITELERKVKETGLELNETSLKVLVAGRCHGSYGCGPFH